MICQLAGRDTLSLQSRALTDGDNYDYHYELVRILPTRLNKAVFLLWDSLLEAVQTDYIAVKDRLKEAFGHKQFMDRFRASLSTRPGMPQESLEVYTAKINKLVLKAFPD